jgi:predicted dienelactone hydrolase
VTIGATPDLTRIAPYRAAHQDRVCAVLKDRNFDMPIPAAAWTHDPRVRAAVIAAPTLGFTFTPDGLAPIKTPVHLWRPANDEITPHPRHAEAIVACHAETARRAPAVCRDATEFDRDAFHRTFRTAVVAFFRARLLTP